GTVVTTVIPPLPEPEADLTIVSLNSSPNPVSIGSPLVYSFTFANKGPSVAYNTIITDVLPPSVTLVSVPAGCSAVDNTITCPFGNNGGGGGNFGTDIEVIPNELGTITNTVSVTSTTPDPDPSNNS